MGDGVRLSRRTFVKWVGGASAGFYLFGRFPGNGASVPLAPIPGGTLDPASVTKYATSMLIPPVMPRKGVVKQKGGKNVDYYEISMRQFRQRLLPDSFYDTLKGDVSEGTLVWGYGGYKAAESNRGLMIWNAPSLTIEARHNRPVRVKWINELREDPEDAESDFLPHLLPADPTLHWANPPGGEAGRDTHPAFAATPGPYTGPVPMVTHVHGAVGVGDESDGYAEAWFLPAAGNMPAGYATEGTWYEFFAGKAKAAYGADWGDGFATSQYPNLGRASADWYHDHTLGMTRLNVYAGPAGFYIIRGGPDGDDAVLDSRGGTKAKLPGPAPRENDKVPPNKRYREIAIAIQDRSFDDDGSLFYPDTRAFFDGITGPYIPDTDISPIWNPEFFGNTIVVNGNTWPYLEVEQRRYRFRVLNGCQSRFLILYFGEIEDVAVWTIGNEGGFLDAPVDLTTEHGNRLLMGPAERADRIVDFTNVPVGSHVLRNVGPDEPFKGFNEDGTLTDGEGGELDPADPGTTGQVMQFQVVPAVDVDDSTPPEFLVLPAAKPLPEPSETRALALLEELSAFFADAPAETLLGTVDEDGMWTKRLWAEPVTENPAVGATETWELYNASADAHPIHIHEVAFEVVDRQDIVVDEDDETVEIAPRSEPVPPEPWETGYKDTVIAYPGQVTRVRAQFNTPGQYVWHCHIVEHEDNEMMRPYRIGQEQPGQPS